MKRNTYTPEHPAQPTDAKKFMDARAHVCHGSTVEALIKCFSIQQRKEPPQQFPYVVGLGRNPMIRHAAWKKQTFLGKQKQRAHDPRPPKKKQFIGLSLQD